MTVTPQDLRQFASLVQIMKTLRGPGGCPWDQEQTHASLTRYAIEEAYELVEVIENDKTSQTTDLVEELGDLLLQVVFHAELGRERGAFTIEDVIQSINEKMVFRHPHVFPPATAELSGDAGAARAAAGVTATATSSQEVLENWVRLKDLESTRKKKLKTKSVFGIPPALPALEIALKIGEKTRASKFDWPDVPGVLAKMREEIDELEEAYAEGTIAEHEHELGDVLFTVAQVARHLNVNAEQALRKTNRRFENRYVRMNELLGFDGLSLAAVNDDVKEEYWQRAKAELKASE